MSADGPIAKLVWHPYGPKTPYWPEIGAAAVGDGVATLAGGAVTVGRFVVQAADDGYFDMCGNQAVKISALAASKATTAGDQLRLIPCLTNMLWAIMYAGTHTLVATDIGTEFGMDSDGKFDTDNTTQDLFLLLGFDDTWAYVTIDPALIVGLGGSCEA